MVKEERKCDGEIMVWGEGGIREDGVGGDGGLAKRKDLAN